MAEKSTNFFPKSSEEHEEKPPCIKMICSNGQEKSLPIFSKQSGTSQKRVIKRVVEIDSNKLLKLGVQDKVLEAVNKLKASKSLPTRLHTATQSSQYKNPSVVSAQTSSKMTKNITNPNNDTKPFMNSDVKRLLNKKIMEKVRQKEHAEKVRQLLKNKTTGQLNSPDVTFSNSSIDSECSLKSLEEINSILEGPVGSNSKTNSQNANKITKSVSLAVEAMLFNSTKMNSDEKDSSIIQIKRDNWTKSKQKSSAALQTSFMDEKQRNDFIASSAINQICELAMKKDLSSRRSKSTDVKLPKSRRRSTKKIDDFPINIKEFYGFDEEEIDESRKNVQCFLNTLKVSKYKGRFKSLLTSETINRENENRSKTKSALTTGLEYRRSSDTNLINQQFTKFPSPVSKRSIIVEKFKEKVRQSSSLLFPKELPFNVSKISSEKRTIVLKVSNGNVILEATEPNMNNSIPPQESYVIEKTNKIRTNSTCEGFDEFLTGKVNSVLDNRPSTSKAMTVDTMAISLSETLPETNKIIMQNSPAEITSETTKYESIQVNKKNEYLRNINSSTDSFDDKESNRKQPPLAVASSGDTSICDESAVDFLTSCNLIENDDLSDLPSDCESMDGDELEGILGFSKEDANSKRVNCDMESDFDQDDSTWNNRNETNFTDPNSSLKPIVLENKILSEQEKINIVFLNEFDQFPKSNVTVDPPTLEIVNDNSDILEQQGGEYLIENSLNDNIDESPLPQNVETNVEESQLPGNEIKLVAFSNFSENLTLIDPVTNETISTQQANVSSETEVKQCTSDKFAASKTKLTRDTRDQNMNKEGKNQEEINIPKAGRKRIKPVPQILANKKAKLSGNNNNKEVFMRKGNKSSEELKTSHAPRKHSSEESSKAEIRKVKEIESENILLGEILLDDKRNFLNVKERNSVTHTESNLTEKYKMPLKESHEKKEKHKFDSNYKFNENPLPTNKSAENNEKVDDITLKIIRKNNAGEVELCVDEMNVNGGKNNCGQTYQVKSGNKSIKNDVGSSNEATAIEISKTSRMRKRYKIAPAPVSLQRTRKNIVKEKSLELNSSSSPANEKEKHQDDEEELPPTSEENKGDEQSSKNIKHEKRLPRMNNEKISPLPRKKMKSENLSSSSNKSKTKSKKSENVGINEEEKLKKRNGNLHNIGKLLTTEETGMKGTTEQKQQSSGDKEKGRKINKRIHNSSDHDNSKESMTQSRNTAIESEESLTQHSMETQLTHSAQDSNKSGSTTNVKYHPKLFLVEKREDLYTENSIVKKLKISVRKNEVKCGMCGDIVTIKQWNGHIQKEHYCLGWKDGEEPLDLTSYNKVLYAMISNFKMYACKTVKCKFCGSVFKSPLGFLYHITTCQATEEEKQQYRTNCENCGKDVMILTYQIHLKRCSKSQISSVENEKPKDEVKVYDDSGRLKRQSVIRAEQKLKEVKEEFTAADKYLFIKRHDGRQFNGLVKKWRNDIELGKEGKCSGKKCDFTSGSLENLMEHYKTCKNLIKSGFACTRCDFVHKEENVVWDHVKSKHILETETIEFEDSGSDAEFDSESSDSENTLSENEETIETETKSKHVSEQISNNIKPFIYDIRGRHDFIKEARKWITEFRERNYSKTKLFPYVLPNVVEIVKNFDMYLPKQLDSLNISIPSKKYSKKGFGSTVYNSLRKLHQLQSDIITDDLLIFLGGPITSMAWLPYNEESENNQVIQYIAVSCRNDFNKYTPANCTNNAYKSCIVIYKLVLNPLNTNEISSEILYGLTLENGPVSEMQFLPSGGFCENINRLGLLAVGCSSTNIFIYSLPLKALETCDSKEEYSNKLLFINLKPSIKLTLDLSEINSHNPSIDDSRATKILWSQLKGHNIIAAGYSNGFVGVWNISDEDNLNKIIDEKSNCVLFAPIAYFQCSNFPVISLDFHYDGNEERWLVIGIQNSYTKLFDLRNVNSIQLLAVDNSKCNSKIVWPFYWENYLCTNSDESEQHIAGTFSCNPVIEARKSLGGVVSFGVTDVCCNLWYNTSILSTRTGDVLVSPLKDWRNGKSKAKSKAKSYYYYYKSCTDLVPLKENNNSKEYFKNILRYDADKNLVKFNEIQSNCAVVMSKFHEFNEKEFDGSTLELPPFHLEKFVRINRIECNPNKNSKNYIAIGYESGFLRIAKIDYKTLSRDKFLFV